jgi:hypothetical protein
MGLRFFVQTYVCAVWFGLYLLGVTVVWPPPSGGDKETRRVAGDCVMMAVVHLLAIGYGFLRSFCRSAGMFGCSTREVEVERLFWAISIIIILTGVFGVAATQDFGLIPQMPWIYLLTLAIHAILFCLVVGARLIFGLAAGLVYMICHVCAQEHRRQSAQLQTPNPPVHLHTTV